jgi:hypothetical protein
MIGWVVSTVMKTMLGLRLTAGHGEHEQKTERETPHNKRSLPSVNSGSDCCNSPRSRRKAELHVTLRAETENKFRPMPTSGVAKSVPNELLVAFPFHMRTCRD